MKFGLLMELQYPRPWIEGGEVELFHNTLAEVELADRLGYHAAWEVEHHFLEEYSHSSSPEVFLAAVSQRTERIRLGHGIVLMPPAYNPTARVAERIATLDILSRGRVEFGVGESASRAELEAFGVTLQEKRAMWLEATEQVANMLALDPYPGFQGKYVQMPSRNVVPKAVQRPHPPMWMACSNREQIHLAATLGLGALTFALVDPRDTKDWVDDYYNTIKSEQCVPIGHTVNANIAMVSNLSLHEDEEIARERGLDGMFFFQIASAHYYVHGEHTPGRTDIWEQYQSVKGLLERLAPRGAPSGIGTVEQARQLMSGYREAGCDQVLFIGQSGKAQHEHVCESLETFASEIMPSYLEEDEALESAKHAELEPYIEAALRRKEWMEPLRDEEIPSFVAFNRPIVDPGAHAEGEELEPDSWQAVLRMLMERTGISGTGGPRDEVS